MYPDWFIAVLLVFVVVLRTCDAVFTDLADLVLSCSVWLNSAFELGGL
jgi:hypothetical protein